MAAKRFVVKPRRVLLLILALTWRCTKTTRTVKRRRIRRESLSNAAADTGPILKERITRMHHRRGVPLDSDPVTQKRHQNCRCGSPPGHCRGGLGPPAARIAGCAGTPQTPAAEGGTPARITRGQRRCTDSSQRQAAPHSRATLAGPLSALSKCRGRCCLARRKETGNHRTHQDETERFAELCFTPGCTVRTPSGDHGNPAHAAEWEPRSV